MEFGTEDDGITANLYSDLLIKLLPKVRSGEWLILSGILRSQQGELVRAPQRNHFDILSVKRRGKWMAYLARRTGTLRRRSVSRQIFAAVIDRRYSKARCKLKGSPMRSSRPTLCENRVPAASLAG
jgi:ribosomal protein L11 methyltransferase PrmA